MAGRVIGLGQEWAGDDGAGIAVVRKLKETGAPIDLVEVVEPTELMALLIDGADPVVLVDAMVDRGSAGRVVVLDADAGQVLAEHLLSTHGFGPLQAIELARTVEPAKVAQNIFIVGITIGEARGTGPGLSEAVAAVIGVAAREALKLVDRQ